MAFSRATFAFLIGTLNSGIADAATLVCDGQEIAAGRPARSGQVEFDIRGPSLVWHPGGGGPENVITAAEICGEAVTASLCTLVDMSMSQTLSKRIYCRTTDVPRHAVSGALIYNQINFTGKAQCRGTEVRRMIDFSNCRSAADLVTVPPAGQSPLTDR